MKKFVITISCAAIFSACSNATKVSSDKALLETANDTASIVSVSRDILDEMMRTLPSPIETANMISQSKSEFKREFLIPAENADRFEDKYSQAIALGGYGVDLGYLNLNNKTLYVLSYLESLNTIAKDLKVDQFLNFSVLNELAKNKNNVDSLIQISTENFNHIDEYLRTQNRGDLSVLILVGSWVEGLHMFNNIAKKEPSEDILKRIGEQKIIINNMHAILSKLENIPYYKELKQNMSPLKKTFDKVKISYVYSEPTTKEVNGQLVIEDKTETIVVITKEDLRIIDKEITALRNKLFLISK